MTSPQERTIRQGFENKVPRTSDDFARVWKNSPERAKLAAEIEEYNREYKVDGQHLEEFKDSRRAQQSKYQRVTSPYTLSYVGQVKLCLRRGFWRLKGDPTLTLTQLFGNFIMSLILSSIFYDLQPTTSSFFSRSAILFFAILLNAFGSALEVRWIHVLLGRLSADICRSLLCTPSVLSSKSIRATPFTILHVRLWLR
jgi:ATP-binding cassette, subfamily G (WHITE), member 2, PDR